MLIFWPHACVCVCVSIRSRYHPYECQTSNKHMLVFESLQMSNVKISKQVQK